MFKKMLVIMMVLGLVFTFTGQSMAKSGGVDFGPAGWYERSKGGENGKEYQYFGGGHPINQSQWTYYGENPPVEPYETPEVLRTASVFLDGVAVGESHAFDGDVIKNGSYAQADGYAGYGGEFRLFADAEGMSCERIFDHWGSYYVDLGWFGGYWVSYPVYRYEYTDNEAWVGSIFFGDAQLIAFGKAKTFAEVTDFGYTTESEAKSWYDKGSVTFIGSAIGKNGELEYASTKVKFNGNFSQETYAFEIEGYTFAEAGGWSSLNFSGGYGLKEKIGNGSVSVFESYSDGINAEVYGFSTVTIDPSKSFVAHTENYSTLSFNPCKQPAYFESQVIGNGFVNGQVVNGGSFGMGTATFNYSGYTNGSGSANIAAEITQFNGGTTVIVNGSSSAVANGFGGNSDGIIGGGF